MSQRRTQRIAAHVAPSPTMGVSDALSIATGATEFSSKKHGGVSVAEVLKEHGVKWIFCLSGGHISPILVEAEQAQGIKIVDVRHEVNAVFAADAVARLTGVPGVAAVTAGPGLTNTVTAVKNAQMAESPLVLLGGAAATLTKNRGALQDIDQMSLFKPICKFSATCSSVRHIVPTLRKAFQEAASGVPGPVFVELPLDVLYPITEAMAGMGLANRAYKKDVDLTKDRSRVLVPTEYKNVESYWKAIKPKEAVMLKPLKKLSLPIEMFMKFQLRSLYADAWADKRRFPMEVFTAYASEAEINQALGYLTKAKRPVIVLGSQSTVGGPKATLALAAALNKLKIPAFLGGMSRGLLGKDSDVHIRQGRGNALAKADFVLLAGAVCDFRMGYGRALPSNAKIVSVNRSKSQGTLNSGMFWSYSQFSETDPGRFVADLAMKWDSNRSETFKEWREDLKKKEVEKSKANAALAKVAAVGRVPQDALNSKSSTTLGKGQKLVNPVDLLMSLDDVLPENSILVADGGDFVGTAANILRPRGPLSWLDPGAFGTLGVGGGFALGAALVHPEKQIFIVWGDGSCGYSIAEFDTYTRFGLNNITAVVGNDASWTQIAREQIHLFGAETACQLNYCDYDIVAQGYGGFGVAVSSPDVDLKEFLSKSLEEQKKVNRPMLINAHIGATNFREGSISV